jgi:hypothetical protein
MSKSKAVKSAHQKRTDEAAQAAREKELRELIDRAEKEQSGSSRPEHERPNDFVQRRMREK